MKIAIEDVGGCWRVHIEWERYETWGDCRMLTSALTWIAGRVLAGDIPNEPMSTKKSPAKDVASAAGL